ncbi:Hypothetical predicted protein [Pelobates cultripes]|uniref:Transposase n=1 Tax=Pelobates cultripes TaxID=61616 RepID=A0AAD1RF65_PELCU|nr:Hypothetical predicted protein [Pelobates cultripes]
MGKSRRPHTPGPSQAGSPGRTSGPMDGYVCTPRDMRSAPAASKMAPASPGDSSSDSLTQGSPRGDTLAHISSELAKITANMLSRADKAEMLAEIRTAIREEVMEVRKDLTALEQRVEALEADRAQTVQHQQATDTATTRQELLTDLFTHILGDRAPEDYGIERAHRALRPLSPEGPPRDVICCLLSYALKDGIMRAARNQQNIAFRDGQVSLYQDLSALTLEARRALRPVTAILRERRIPYKWGFPFSLQARVGQTWHIIRWPADVPRFLRATSLPAVTISNWVLERQPQHPRAVSDRPGTGLTGSGFRRGGPDSHEE